MIFRHQTLDKTLEWTETVHLCELVIENPSFLRKILRDLSTAEEEQELGFIVNGQPLSFDKEVDVIFNPLKLDFNNRRATATLLKLLVKASLSENFYLETSELKTRIIKYLGRLTDHENFNFEVVTSEYGIDDLAKATNLHIVGDEDDFVELITDYMTMMSELASIKVFVFINLRTLLNIEELHRLQHNLYNHQLDVLLVESDDKSKLEQVPRIVIDQDQCEL